MPLGQLVDLGELVLEPECRIQGMVHDENGAGLADVKIGIATTMYQSKDLDQLRRSGVSDGDDLIVTRSDARGFFDLRGLSPGKWLVWGKGESRGNGASEPIELKSGELKSGVDFLVPAFLAVDSIRGRVLDPAGAGAADVRVASTFLTQFGSGSGEVETKQDGTFEIQVMQDAPYELVANDKQHGNRSAPMRNVMPGARDVVLQLLDASSMPTARLRVRGPENEPVGSLKFDMRIRNGSSSYMGSLLTSRELEPGLHEFEVPLKPFGLIVSSQGYLASERIELDPATLAKETLVLLERAPILRGRVIADGKPLGGALVGAQRAVAKGKSYFFNDFPALMMQDSGASATCAADGSFELSLDSKQSAYLRCTAPGFAATVAGPFSIDNTKGPIEIRLDVGGTIQGRVLAKDGSLVVGAIVGVTCGDAHPRTMRSGSDGAFRFEGLSAGHWLVQERKEEFRTDETSSRTGPKEQHISWSCEVVAGRTTYYDLQLDR